MCCCAIGPYLWLLGWKMNRNQKSAKPRLRNNNRLILEIVSTILFLLAANTLFDMTIPRSLVDGRSMLPTFHDGERLVISRIDYMLHAPERGDVIVLNSVNPNEPDVMLIKRVVGLPGDIVELRAQQVYINGVLLNEPYINEPCTPNRCKDASWALAAGEYFVMGDNRNHSNDSRSFGVIPIGHIVGHVVIRYWPPDQIGWIHRIGL